MQLTTKRFVLRKSLIGKDAQITVEFKNGKEVTYSHDKAFDIMKSKLEAMPCWLSIVLIQQLIIYH